MAFFTSVTCATTINSAKGLTLHIRSCLKKVNFQETNVEFQFLTKKNETNSLHQNNCSLKSTNKLDQHQRNCNVFNTTSRTLQTEVVNEACINSYESDILYPYEQMVQWKKELFPIPKCRYGKEFIKETKRNSVKQKKKVKILV